MLALSVNETKINLKKGFFVNIFVLKSKTESNVTENHLFSSLLSLDLSPNS